jgi:uncharacterized protein YjbI with pentapeptide repeats
LYSGSIAAPELPEIQASEILYRIENGDAVIYDHVAIVGDLDVGLIDLPLVYEEAEQGQARMVVASRIQIRDCLISGNVNFSRAHFKEFMDWSGSIFIGEARFKGAAFFELAAFDAAVFDGYATFRDAWFGKDASFSGAKFGAIANFGNVRFSKDASFGSAAFSSICANFSDAQFEGDADFTGAQFPGTANFKQASFGRTASFWQVNFGADSIFEEAAFTGFVSFLKSIFGGIADFRHSEFAEDLTFELALFRGNCIFLSSSFQGDVNFSSARFLGPADFNSVALKDAVFWEAEFHQLSFSRAKIEGNAHFERARFIGAAHFLSSDFGATANFSAAAFSCTASFEDAQFRGSSNFTDALFAGEATFDRTRFIKDVSFSSAQFKEKAQFMGAVFCEDLKARGARFTESCDLTASEFHRMLSLEDARIHTMRLFSASFGRDSRISLQGADFDRLEVRWESIKDWLVYDGAVYLALIKNFKNLEWFDDADDCYFQYRKRSQAEKKLFAREAGGLAVNWSKLLDCLAWISCGYGVRPSYTVYLSILLIVLFAGLYWTGDSIVVEHINSTAVGSHLAPADEMQSLSFADHLYFSAMIFTARAQVKWFPAGVYRYLATLESILGWLLMALFLVTLGRIMIR